MRLGQLKHRIIIQNPEKVEDSMGGYTETWNTVAVRQGAIWNYKGKEKMVNGKLTEALKLPSGGDTSYAGLVWHDGLLWISYYSSHEGKTNIYLAKVRIDRASS